jgi:thiamine biosynthesis lipoprotein
MIPRIALPDRVDEAAVRAHDASLPLVTMQGETMGTVWRIHAVPPRGVEPIAIRHAVQARLDALVAQMSHWEPESELCRFNRLAAGEWAVISPDFATVMQAALDIARASDGAFSPSIGALVDLWGFARRGRLVPRPMRSPSLLPCPLRTGACRVLNLKPAVCGNRAVWRWISPRLPRVTPWMR